MAAQWLGIAFLLPPSTSPCLIPLRPHISSFLLCTNIAAHFLLLAYYSFLSQFSVYSLYALTLSFINQNSASTPSSVLYINRRDAVKGTNVEKIKFSDAFFCIRSLWHFFVDLPFFLNRHAWLSSAFLFPLSQIRYPYSSCCPYQCTQCKLLTHSSLLFPVIPPF